MSVSVVPSGGKKTDVRRENTNVREVDFLPPAHLSRQVEDEVFVLRKLLHLGDEPVKVRLLVSVLLKLFFRVRQELMGENGERDN
jgi:hypothetical protein